MPGVRTHDFINVTTAVVAAPVALWAGMPPIEVGALTGAFIFSSFFFSPDLDLHSRPYLRWSVLRFLWLPYQYLVPHRSWVSHSLVVGPLLRIIYFVVVLYLLGLLALALLHLAVPVDTTGTLWRVTTQLMSYIQRHPTIVFYGVLGFVGSSATHVIADVISTRFKRWRNKLVRRLL
jgi:uncharacterized metal-binding protein